eukprot:362928-Chlamydomonas_euryale.AAC.10
MPPTDTSSRGLWKTPLASTHKKAALVHTGHWLGGTAQSSGRRQDRIKPVGGRPFPLGERSKQSTAEVMQSWV